MKHILTTRLPVLFLISSTAWASTWYINGVSGSDSNNCKSPTTACKTINHAISLASPSDSIIVAAATYKENLTIGKSLTITGSGASTTIIDSGLVINKRVVAVSSAAQVNLSGVTVRNGYITDGSGGGGIYNQGTLTINNATVGGNFAAAFRIGKGGGGILNAGTLTINNSTIIGNTAFCGDTLSPCGMSGGGILNFGALNMNNSTVNGNIAMGHTGGVSYGGGIATGGSLRVANSTISGNSASYRGKGDNIAGAATLKNSIVANSKNGNCAGAVHSGGYNLSSDNTCNFNGPGDMNNTNPNLGPLQNNGGQTQTQALPSGSPAIDAGDPSGCKDGLGLLLKTDQRGEPRPDPEDAGGCDMGAYERQSD